MKVSIVIPAKNESESLSVLLPNLINMIQSQPKKYHWEIILVDDVSSDQTRNVIKHWSEKYDYITPIYLKKSSGQTGCFQVAFNRAKGDYIIRMDADLQDNPSDLPLFLHAFSHKAELVVGLREGRKHRRIFRLAAHVYDFLVVLLFNSSLHANSGSFVGFKTSYVKNIKFKKNDHRYFPLIILRRGAKTVKEVIVRHGYRRFGRSKYNPWKKIIFGFFEVWVFFIRLSFGYYDKKN